MEEKRYALLIRADETWDYVECDEDGGLSLERLQELVGGYIESVPSVLALEWADEADTDGIVIICNENGKLKHLRENTCATDMSDLLLDCIVEDAVLMRAMDDEWKGFLRAPLERIVSRWLMV